MMVMTPVTFLSVCAMFPPTIMTAPTSLIHSAPNPATTAAMSDTRADLATTELPGRATRRARTPADARP